MNSVLLFINHVYLVLSPESFQAIQQNEFLKTHFVNIEHKKLDSKTGLTWEGLYLRGEETYIELFYPQGEVQFSKKGNSGIGLGTDKIGDINLVYENLKNNAKDISKNLFTRNVDGVEKDWFDYVVQKDSFIAPHLSLWAMEYKESYCGSKDVSRKTYNKPYYHPQKLFKNITGITLAVDVSAQENFINLLTHSGYTCQKKSEGHYSCKSHDFVVEIIPEAKDVKGIQEIDILLNKKVEKSIHTIGQTVLSLENNVAHWKMN